MNNLRTIVGYFRSANPKVAVLIVSPPPINEVKWHAHCAAKHREGSRRNRDNDVTRQYAEAALALAAELDGVVGVDLWSALGGHDQEAAGERLHDGLHFNAKGTAVAYDTIKAAIEAHVPWLAPDRLEDQGPQHKDIDEVRPAAYLEAYWANRDRDGAPRRQQGATGPV